MVATATATDYRCPQHPDTRLTNVLKGGAGFCARCNQFVQAAGVPPPVLDAHVAAKRAAAASQRKPRRGRPANV